MGLCFQLRKRIGGSSNGVLEVGLCFGLHGFVGMRWAADFLFRGLRVHRRWRVDRRSLGVGVLIPGVLILGVRILGVRILSVIGRCRQRYVSLLLFAFALINLILKHVPLDTKHLSGWSAQYRRHCSIFYFAIGCCFFFVLLQITPGRLS
jgi:hypothetical protein